MKVVSAVVFIVVVGAVTVACGGGSARTEVEPAVVSAEPSLEVVQEEDAPALEVVVVDAAGTDFDPAVEIEQIPDGAWYCDMGTVHYARLERGDGRCSRCGMNLIHMVSEGTPAGEANAAPDEE